MIDYAEEFRAAADQVAYLREHSGLPGPRGNLELMQAAVDVGDEARFRQWIALGGGTDPTDEFLGASGVVGLGRLVAEGRDDIVPELRDHASDSRWRVREGVAMALQRVGDADVGGLLEIARDWAEGSPHVQRAAVAAVAEPRLIREPEAGRIAVDVVDRVTTLLTRMEERRSDEFRVLRQALAYCWSVVTAASPAYGKALMERWAGSADRDVHWILRENLKKTRLTRLDPEWVASLRDRLG
jgi:hypothetical protein